MTDILVDQAALRDQVQQKYREVALEPDAPFHFHTGRSLAARLGYAAAAVDATARRGRRVLRRRRQPVLAARPCSRASASSTSAPAPGSTPSSPPARSDPTGRVVGVDMTPEMLEKVTRAPPTSSASTTSSSAKVSPKQLPVEDGWADVVISNGVINLCADKRSRVRRDPPRAATRRRLQFADIANGRPVPPRRCATSTSGPVESPAGCPVRAGRRSSKSPASTDVRSDRAVDTFGGAGGEANARAFEVFGYAFLARSR